MGSDFDSINIILFSLILLCWNPLKSTDIGSGSGVFSGPHNDTGYMVAKKVSELVDIPEIVHRIAELKGTNIEDMEILQTAKSDGERKLG